ncbi:MAG: TetR/AcrR family transcriptional regulator [Methylocella sp.]
MKSQTQSKEHATRLAILSVAERLFAELGFEKTTVADIARELRMSPANVYRFFSAKSEINEAVGRRLLREIEIAGDDIVKRAEPAREKLRGVLAMIDRANDDRFHSRRKLHDLLETAFSENWAIAHGHVEKITGLLGEIISQGHREGEFAVSDCELAAHLVRCASIRFWHPRLMAEWFEEPEPTLDQMMDFCLAALTQGAPAIYLDARNDI